MPIYEYACERCGGTFEELVRNAAEAAAVVCSTCGEKRVHRLLSAPASPVPAGCAPGGGGFT